MKLARQLLEKELDEEEEEVVPEGSDDLQSGDLSANGACREEDEDDASREAGAGDSFQE